MPTGEWATDYLPPEGRYHEYAWAGAPTDTPMMLLVEGDQWQLRNGQSWNTATELGPFTVTTDDGLWLGDTQLLPQQVGLDSATEQVEVTDMGSAEVYYGTFSSSVSVEILAGDFLGPATLAVEHGPIVLTWQGVTWELVYYE